MATQKPTKEQLLKAIEKLEKDDNFGGFLVDVGLGAVGAVGAGAAVATFGGTSILFGLITVAPPVGLVVGGAALGGAALVGIKKIFFDGTFDEGKKTELLRQLKDQLREVEAKERSSKIKESDKSKLIVMLKEPIKYDLISPEKAQKLIDAVASGKLPLTEAYELIKNLLN
jgi:hypothetical protein